MYALQLEYGYQLQQNLLGATSFKALMESLPDTCCYKSHQRNTLVMHPSPVLHLRLLLRLLLAPVELAQQQQGAAGADGAANNPNSSKPGSDGSAGSSSSSNKILAALAGLAALQPDAGPIMGAVTGFSAATAIYPGCPASNVKPALDLLATAVDSALSSGSSLGIDGPAGCTVYPVVAVQQAFEAVYGYKLPLHRLGVEHFKQLLLELEGEASLTPEHRVTGGTGTGRLVEWKGNVIGCRAPNQ
jgi:hypothetical protein